MSKKIEPKKFNFDDIEGLSLNQLEQHYQLYKGYVRKINEIWNILETEKKFKNPNPTYSSMRSLKLGESYSLDGVKLHEMYFENLGAKFNIPYGDILRLINRDFGSYKEWVNKLIDVGLSMRGWAVMAIDPIDNRLHIYGQDAHDVGAIWKAWPLLVLDVYEHAYMIDFGIDRKRYLNVFLKNIDWKIVNKRLRNYYTKQEGLTSSSYYMYPYYSMPYPYF